jgi:hypothetical protein
VIIVRVFMRPGGDESREYEMATAVIVNDGTGTPTTGSYHGGFSVGRGKVTVTRSVRTFSNLKFPRQRKSVWYLIARGLREAGIE